MWQVLGNLENVELTPILDVDMFWYQSENKYENEKIINFETFYRKKKCFMISMFFDRYSNKLN